jgi:hypothetical protein
MEATGVYHGGAAGITWYSEEERPDRSRVSCPHL